MEPSRHPHSENRLPEYSIDSTSPLLDSVDKDKHRRLFKRGINWLGTGIVLMVTSFAVNMLFHQSAEEFLTPLMYLMTSVGSIAIMKGLVDILGF